jgi:hypothetical protein
LISESYAKKNDALLENGRSVVLSVAELPTEKILTSGISNIKM